MFYNNNIYGGIVLPKLLSKEETNTCLQSAQEGNKEAIDKLVTHNLRLVIYIVNKHCKFSPFEIEDLISVGTIGLLKAVNTFKSEKGYLFATYAFTCIFNEIMMFFRKNNKALPNISLDELSNLNSDTNNENKINYLVDENDLVKDYETKETYKEIREALLILTPIEKRIVELLYGFNDERISQLKIAELLNISQSYVCRINKKAHVKIKEYIKTNNIF